MSKSNTTENDILLKVFNNTAFSWDAASTLYLSLHTADPGEAGNQTTNETSYTSYARVAVSRNAGGWTVTGNTVNNTALLQFPMCTGGSSTVTYLAVGTAVSGTGQILYSGALAASLAISNLVQPQFAATSIQIVED